MPNRSFSFKLSTDTSQVKSNLGQLQKDFRRAAKGLKSSLDGVDVFRVLREQIRGVNFRLKEAKSRVSELQAEINRGGATDGLVRQFEEAKKSVESYKEELLRTQQTLKRKLSGTVKLASARDLLKVVPHKEITSRIDKVREAYRRLAKSGQLTRKELAQAKVAMLREIADLQKQTNGWVKALDDVKVAVAGVAAGAAGVAKATRLGISFESEMAGVAKTTGGTRKEIVALGNELQKMSTRIPRTAEEFARIAAVGGQLGIPLKDLSLFSELAAKMATAFDMTTDEAGESIGKLRNIFDLDMAGIEEFGDAINQLGNTTAAKERDIVAAMLRIGGTSEQFGLAKEEAAALAAAMIGLGQPPEVAGTAISTMLNKMQTANVGTEKFKKALLDIGWSAEEMAEMVRQNPQQAVTSLLETLKELDSQKRAEIITSLFGEEHNKSIATLVSGLNSYQKALGQVSDKTQLAGAMNKEFDAKLATAGVQLVLLKNTFVDIARSVGEGFLPAIGAAAKFLRGVLSLFADLVREMPEVAAGFTAFAGGLLGLRTMRKAVDILKLATLHLAENAIVNLSKFASVVKTVSIGLATLARTTAAFLLSNPAGWAILIAGGAVAAVTKLYTLREEIKRLQAELAETKAKTAQYQQEEAAAWQKVSAALHMNITSLAEFGAAKRKIAADTGFQFTNIKELQEGVRRQRIYWDEVEKVWKAGANATAGAADEAFRQQKITAGMTLDEIKKKYRSYVDEVIRLQNRIAGNEESVQEQLRSMARTGMSDYAAWKDMKKQADEYAASARKAMQAGDYKGAEKYAAKARDMYADLNKEVKEGDKVLIGQTAALKAAMSGVKKMGALQNEALKKQQGEIEQTIQKMEEEAGFSRLFNSLEPEKQKWLSAWRYMSEEARGEISEVKEELSVIVSDSAVNQGQRKWNQMFRDFQLTGTKKIKEVADEIKKMTDRQYTINLDVKRTIKRQTGGPIQALAAGGGVRNMLRGGHFPGFGGGDRRHVLAEDGEYMLNKHVVRAAGVRAAEAFNMGRWGLLMKELLARFGNTLALADGGGVRLPSISLPPLPRIPQTSPAAAAPIYNLSLNFAGNVSPAGRSTAREQARLILDELDKMNRRRSR